MKNSVAKIGTVLFLIILSIAVTGCIGLLIIYASFGQYEEKPDPAETAIVSKYDSLFNGAKTTMSKDRQAEDKNYKHRYGHGIYHIFFESKPGGNDFKTFSSDSLKKLSLQVTRDFLPIMTNRELYDSILVYFVTNYPVKKEGGIVVADTSSMSFTKIFEYSAR